MRRTSHTLTGFDGANLHVLNTMLNEVYAYFDHGALYGLTDKDHPASAIFTNTTAFSGNLSAADTDVQKALDTLDELGFETMTAGTALSALRVVRADGSGNAVYGDFSTVSHLPQLVGMTVTSAAGAGVSVKVLLFGKYIDAGWTWTPGAWLFLGANGTMTHTPPTLAGGAAFSLPVARALTATKIRFSIGDPIIL